ncbi:tyrosine-type recombinase/integrase [Amycolatopsis thermoflava]|uniref:tyrosine-type recombinase/integrase n=1 Tax=Amycolatopsis thermoflava TaxID=84480 RepID=UPI0036595C24
MAFVEKSGKDSWRVRYWRDDGTHGSLSGFRTRKEAQDKADEIDADKRRGTFLDPEAGKLLLAEWIVTWFDAIDVASATLAQYRSLTDNHIIPRWGDTSLNGISGIAVHAWGKKLRGQGYAASTVSTIIKLMAMMLADAADERLIPVNPIQPRRRGRRRHQPRTEQLWATPEQVVAIAAQASALVGLWAGLLIITAAWTGARWGELTGLQRPNSHLDDGEIVIDPHYGALHEVNGQLELGPPKTACSARTISLPPFLIPPLRAYLDSHDHPHVFVSAEHQLLRRSNFSRRAMRPAADGNLHRVRPEVRVQPILPGLRFHDLRHSHKTWMIADGIPEVAQSRRLGHRISDELRDVYSHVAAEVEARLLDSLERRWHDAVASVHEQHGPAITQPLLLAA